MLLIEQLEQRRETVTWEDKVHKIRSTCRFRGWCLEFFRIRMKAPSGISGSRLEKSWNQEGGRGAYTPEYRTNTSRDHIRFMSPFDVKESPFLIGIGIYSRTVKTIVSISLPIFTSVCFFALPIVTALSTHGEFPLRMFQVAGKENLLLKKKLELRLIIGLSVVTGKTVIQVPPRRWVQHLL